MVHGVYVSEGGRDAITDNLTVQDAQHRLFGHFATSLSWH